MKKRRATIVLVVIAVATIAAVGLAVVRRSRAAEAPSVSAVRVRRDALSETISGTGSFVPSVRRTVFSQVSGIVEQVYVSEGDIVQAGTRLLSLDDSDYAQSLEAARVSYQSTRRSVLQQILNLQSAFASAERTIIQVRRTYEKNAELREANAISQEEFQQTADALAEASAAFESARAQLNLYTGRELTADPARTQEEAQAIVDSIPQVVQAALNLQQAEEALADTEPRSPTAGTVAQVAVETGSLVGPNAPLVRIEQLSAMNAEIQIDEVDIGKIQVGNTAEIVSDSILGESLPGTVVRIAPTVQRVGNTRVSTVEVSIDAGDMQLKSGASCTVRISTLSKDNALVIPITAYQVENDSVFVYVLEPSEQEYRVSRRSIELGIATVNFVEVASGLSEGEIVADGNASRLRDGMVVSWSEEL